MPLDTSRPSRPARPSGFTDKFTQLGADNPAPGSPGPARGAPGARLSPPGSPRWLPPGSPPPALLGSDASTSRVRVIAPASLEKAILSSAQKIIEFVKLEGIRPVTHADSDRAVPEETLLKPHVRLKAMADFGTLETSLAGTKPTFFTGKDAHLARDQAKNLFDRLNERLGNQEIPLAQRLAIAVDVTTAMGLSSAEMVPGLEAAVKALDARETEKRILSLAQNVKEFVELEGIQPRPPNGAEPDNPESAVVRLNTLTEAREAFGALQARIAAEPGTQKTTVVTLNTLTEALEAFDVLQAALTLTKPQFFEGEQPDLARAQAKDLFNRLNTHLGDQALVLTQRLDMAVNVTTAMGVCAGGLGSALDGAVINLDAHKKGFPGAVQLATKNILNAHAANHVRATDRPSVGDEVHYVNAHINAFNKTIGLPPAELNNQFLVSATGKITEASFKKSAEVLARELTPHRLAQFLAEEYGDKFLGCAAGERSFAADSKTFKTLTKFKEEHLDPIYSVLPTDLVMRTHDSDFSVIEVAPQRVELALKFLSILKDVDLVDRNAAAAAVAVLIPQHPEFGKVSMLGNMVFCKRQDDGNHQLLGREELCQISLSAINDGLDSAGVAETARTALMGTVVQHVLAEYHQELADYRQHLKDGENPAAQAPPQPLPKQWLLSAADLAGQQKLSAVVTQPLFELAVLSRQSEVVGKLQGTAVNFGQPLSWGETAATVAIWLGDMPMLQALVDAGANVSTPNADGATALMRAAEMGFTDAIQKLTEAGAELEAEDLTGYTALMHAVHKNQIDAIAALGTAGANIDHVSSTRGTSAAMLAAVWGRADALTALLNKGADKKQVGAGGETLLMMAALWNHVEVIQALAPDEDDLQARDAYSRTPLIKAARFGQVQALEVLTALARSHGLSGHVDSTDVQGLSALTHAAFGGHAGAITCLIANGAKKDLITDGGNTVLFWADLRSSACIEALQPSQADLDARNEAGFTPALMAAANGATDTLELLVQDAEDFLKETKMGENALRLAAQGGHTDTLRTLQRMGVDINSASEVDHVTALMTASATGQLETLHSLIHEFKADIHLEDRTGLNAAEVALIKNQPDALFVLCENGAILGKEVGVGPSIDDLLDMGDMPRETWIAVMEALRAATGPSTHQADVA